MALLLPVNPHPSWVSQTPQPPSTFKCSQLTCSALVIIFPIVRIKCSRIYRAFLFGLCSRFVPNAHRKLLIVAWLDEEQGVYGYPHQMRDSFSLSYPLSIFAVFSLFRDIYVFILFLTIDTWHNYCFRKLNCLRGN